MSRAFIDKWSWIFIYAGMALFALGLAIRQSGAERLDIPVVLLGVGGVSTVAGVAMIWWRSRMGDK